MARRKAVRLVLALILVATIFSMAAVARAFLLLYSEPSVPQQATVVLRIGELADGPTGGLDLFGTRRTLSLRQVVDSLKRAKTDPRVSRVLVVPSGLAPAYWARLQEVRAAILDFRESGKPALAYLEYGGQREYYLASACDEIVLMPNSPLDLTGLASYEVFLKGLFDKIGAEPDLHHIGDYKTASNQLTEETFTDAHREMAESLNNDLFEQLVEDIAAARGKTTAELEGLVNQGPFLAEAAHDVGLVDALAYEDQLADLVPEADGELNRLEGMSYARVRGGGLGFGRRARMGLISISGTIASGRGGFDPLYGGIAGSDAIVEQIRRARNDDSLRALIVRIDSPGGSTIASDVIWRELALTREEQPDRPIVVSMSDLAASGGYYVAMPAHAIVAQPGTLTGSIGIYGGKVITGGTYEKIGMNIETVSRGRYADMNSPVRRYDEAELAKLEEQLGAFYDQFIGKVAESRRMTKAEVDAIAQGRVWTGRQAREVGLVDELGGLETAVAVAKRRADLAETVEVELVDYPTRLGPFDLLLDQLGRAALGRLPGGTVRLMQAVAPIANPDGLFRPGEALALMPLVITR